MTVANFPIIKKSENIYSFFIQFPNHFFEDNISLKSVAIYLISKIIFIKQMTGITPQEHHNSYQ